MLRLHTAATAGVVVGVVLLLVCDIGFVASARKEASSDECEMAVSEVVKTGVRLQDLQKQLLEHQEEQERLVSVCMPHRPFPFPFPLPASCPPSQLRLPYGQWWRSLFPAHC